MASFKEHRALGCWKGSLIVDAERGGGEAENGAGQLARNTNISNLPSKKVLSGCIKEAMRLNEAGVKAPSLSRARAPKADLVVTDDLHVAMEKDQAARVTFENFSPSQKLEHGEWFVEAKAPETRNRRLETAIQWMAQGKPRNWKSRSC